MLFLSQNKGAASKLRVQVISQLHLFNAFPIERASQTNLLFKRNIAC